MKYMYLCLVASVILLLIGCSPIYRVDYSYKPPRSEMGRMCTNQCLQAKNSCQQLCDLRGESCRALERQEALSRYQMYSTQQLANHLPVEKSLQDFDFSYSRCASVSDCSCNTDYNMCFQNCGGQVKENRVCTAFCDKQ